MAKRLVDPCDFCGGNGVYVCPTCGGQVHVGGTTQIPNPNGPPGSWTRCPRCQGEGMVLCPKCGGRRKYILTDSGSIEYVNI